ncbi:HAMP domain-containing protein, partial [Trinickia sp.]|uniref:HAMP domain-containing protein n=1 Tax=Trinickia sp. TaxID=2571163 RepID=UPI003F7CD44D
MNIKQKLQLLVAVSVVSLGGGIVVSALSLSTADQTQRNTRRQQEIAVALTEMKAYALSTIETDPTSDDTKHIFADAEQNIEQRAEQIKPLLDDSETQAQVATVLAQWNSYDRKSRDIIDLATRDVKTANDKMTALYHNDFKPMQAEFERLGRAANQQAQRAADTAQRIRTRTRWTIIVVLAAILVLIVGWITALSRSILGALDSIKTTLERASTSLDLTLRAPVLAHDEIGAAATGFNVLMTRVGEAMHAVRQSA